MNQYFNGKLSLFLAEVSFDNSEQKQLSYFQNHYFFQNSLRMSSGKMQIKKLTQFLIFLLKKFEFKFVLFSGPQSYISEMYRISLINVLPWIMSSLE